MKKRNFWKKYKTVLIIAAIALCGGIFYLFRSGSSAAGYTRETVQRRNIITYNSFTGNVEPVTDRSIVPTVSQQVTEVYVKKGDRVVKGQKILQLDTTDVNNSIRLKQALLSSTQTANTYSVSGAQKIYDDYKYALDNQMNASIQAACQKADVLKQTLDTAKTAYSNSKTAMENGTDAGTLTLYTARANASNAADSAKSALAGASADAAAAKAALDAARTASDADGKKAAADAAKAVLDAAAPGTQEYTDALAAYNSAETDYANALSACQTEQDAWDAAQTALANAQTAYNAALAAFNDASAKFSAAENTALSSLQSSIDSAQLNYNNARYSYNAALLQAQQQLATYAENIDKAKAASDTQASQLEIQNLKDSLADYTLTAPCDGTVTDLTAETGDLAAAGKPVGSVATVNSMDVSIRVDEYSVLKAKLGDTVSVYVDSVSRNYPGTITWIADNATLENGVSYYKATVSLQGDADVKSGMSVEVRLTTADAENVVSAAAGSVHYRDDSSAYVYVPGKNGKPEEKDVAVGVSDGSYTEITSGLAEGDTILTETVNQGASAISSFRQRTMSGSSSDPSQENQ